MSGAPRMTGDQARCDWCGAASPRWLLWIDRSPIDTMHRQVHGMPGPTATPLRACDNCRPKMDAAYPPGSQNP